jgi:SagB-type dehydrogenase family enzyme
MAYHHATGYNRHRMTPHYLRWSDVPVQVKTYPNSETVLLEPSNEFPAASLWQVLNATLSPDNAHTIDFRDLSTVLGLAYGVTAEQRMGGQVYRYRSVPSAGALYPAEIYLASSGLSGHRDGLYYYDINRSALIRLRNEDPSIHILNALRPQESSLRQVSFLLSGIFYRSAWKYRNRAFRYVLLDIGHLVENLYLALRLLGMPGSSRYDFEDEALNRLTGVDTQREACFVCVNTGACLPEAERKTAGVLDGISPSFDAHKQASRTAVHETFYQEIADIHRISSQLKTPGPGKKDEFRVVDLAADEWFPVLKTESVPDSKIPFSEAVTRRRSRRNFIPALLPTGDFMHLLALLCEFPTENLNEGGVDGAFLETGFLTSHVEGFDPGFYLLSRSRGAYRRVKPGVFTEKMAQVCLDQAWLKFAAVHFLFMANLKEIDQKPGARGYRYTLMDAGRLAQRLYLGATSLNIGCCGIGALYDGEARTLLSLNDASALLYLVAAGPIKGRGRHP